MTTCDECGQEYQVGEWPFCPHGIPSKGSTAAFKAHYDLALGRYIDSSGEQKRVMREMGVDYRSPKVGMPGCEF